MEIRDKIKYILSLKICDVKDVGNNLIFLIDEPIIKNKLYEMFVDKFPNSKSKKFEEELIISYAQKYGRNISFE